LSRESVCTRQQEALAELQKLAPDAPFLALGQTIFWDEPLKAGVIRRAKELGFSRRFVAGVHDTDYFAKLPHTRGAGLYAAVPHNDTTTKELWSAAGEFSVLFGSETVVSRDRMHNAGLRLSMVQRKRGEALTKATEAFGWRGIAALNQNSMVIAEKPLGPVFPILHDTFVWAIETTSSMAPASSAEKARQLRAIFCNPEIPVDELTLSQFYQRLLPEIQEWLEGEPIGAEITATSELLRFNTTTCNQPRFEIVGYFLNPEQRKAAREAYDESVRGTEMYSMDRFGTGAVPFDLYIPGVGRGTLRIGNRGIVVGTSKPVFASLRKPITSLAELADVIERKWGPNCVLVGKAVSLIGMLGREFVFVFHSGASNYLPRCLKFHQELAKSGINHAVNPVLRVRYEPWDALCEEETNLVLPEPLQGPFKAVEITGRQFCEQWRGVAEAQNQLLARLSELRRPVELLQFFADQGCTGWAAKLKEFQGIQERLGEEFAELSDLKARKRERVVRWKALAAERCEKEKELGRHWREKLFEKQPSETDWEMRKQFLAEIEQIARKIREAQSEWRGLQAEQDRWVAQAELKNAQHLRHEIELEAEMQRMKLIRDAVITTDGLFKAGHRPSAWWFPLVSPSGSWLRNTHLHAEYTVEALR